jgi:NOL1/NOP2/sun family putative RNA methylase
MQLKLSLLPPQFLDRVRRIVPTEYIHQVESAFMTKRLPTFRANALKISGKELYNKLSQDGFQLDRVKWYEDAFILKNRTQKELMETNEYKNGALYIQSLSSMIPALLINPEENDTILDLTAAPGSKTTQLAAQMNNNGKIVANDRSFIRIEKLKANLKNQGVTNVEITQLPGQIIWQEYPEYFDKTLVDVPCSLEGRFSVLDLKSFRDWSTKKVKLLTQTQKFLLRSAVSATKVGGIIVYSTCTLAPEENEAIINWILLKEKDALEVVKPTLFFPSSTFPIREWLGDVYRAEVEQSLRILPSSLYEGFFVAILKKTKSTVSSAFVSRKAGEKSKY